MKRRSRLGTVLRLAELKQGEALRALGDALASASELHGRVASTESAHRGALAEARPSVGRAKPAHALQNALFRARVLDDRASELRPESVQAEARLQEAQTHVAREKARTRALEHAIARRGMEERLRQRRREARQIDDAVRSARGRSGEAHG